MKYYEVRYGTISTKVRENHCSIFVIILINEISKKCFLAIFGKAAQPKLNKK